VELSLDDLFRGAVAAVSQLDRLLGG